VTRRRPELAEERHPSGRRGWPPGFAEGDANRRAVLVLGSLGLTPRNLYRAAGRLGAASACLAAVRRGELGSEPDARLAGEIDVDAAAAALEACGARMVTPADDGYPEGLLDLADPPAALFVRGMDLPSEATVAIVGARNCSATGGEVARELGYGLAAAGMVTVSGAARGIDTASHEGSLAAGGRTIAVLGCGIDVAYPPSNLPLLQRVAAGGTVVSEYPPGVPAMPFRFPARNRIIAALAEAVVIVEGAEGSGSLITADHALDLGRLIFAVPGSVTSQLSEVPLALLRDGAGLIRGSQDLLLDLGRLDPRAGMAPPGTPGPLTAARSEEDHALLAALAGPTLPDEIARALGWDLGLVLGRLVGLELAGLVRVNGGRYERAVPGARPQRSAAP
jgi:DNA processing protein